MTLTPGTTLGPYTITQRLGAGGMGEVYLARDTRLDREVALKVLPESLTGTPEARARFEHEARAAARINHPHVCTIHDIGRDGDTSYLIFELIDGDTLQERLRTGPLPTDLLLPIAIDIADALVAAHAKAIVHRDLKPANIMLTPEGAKVMDFGIAAVARADDGRNHVTEGTLTEAPDKLTTPGSAVGTAAYMSPEQARGERVDARSDLFSFGSVLYEMATQRPPFQGATTAVLFDGILNRDPAALSALRPGLPSEFERIVLKALEKDRKFRYQTASELRADLMRLKRDFDSSKVVAPRSESTTSAPKFLSTARVRWILALGALGLAAILVWLFAGQNRGPQTGPGTWAARRLSIPEGCAEHGQCVISPDGTEVAYLPDSGAALAFLSLDTSDRRVVDRLATDEGHYFSVDWTADGSKFVVTRCDPLGNVMVLLVDLVTGHRDVLARLGRLGQDQANDLMPSLSPSGVWLAIRRVYRPSTGAFSELWGVNVRQGIERLLVHVGANQSVGPPVWSPSDDRLAYVLTQGDRESTPIETCDLRGVRTTAIEDSSGGLSPAWYGYRSMRWQEDHRLIYTMRTSRSGDLGDAELWSIPVDTKSGRTAGRGQFLYALPGATLYSPSASKDGRRITFTATHAIRALRLIDPNGRDRYPELSSGAQLASLRFPIWARDGQGLFVRSEESPPQGAIGRIRLSDGRFDPLTPVVASGDKPLCLTPDGQELVCQIGSRLVAVPVEGGAPRTLAERFSGVVRCTARANRCVAVERSGDDFVVRDFDPKIGPGAMRFRYRVPGFDPHEQSSEDLSPDGTRLVVLRADLPGYAVLDASSGRELDRIRLPAHSFPQSVRWAADGTTLYASGQDVIAGKWIVRLGAHGVEQVLWKSENVWPGHLDLSPDGSTIAFTSLEFNHDMWLIERH